MTDTPTAAGGGFWRSAVALGRDIKLSHSVFALPFALLATFLAAGASGSLPGWATLTLIVLCMVTARTVAMSVNRLADASMDAANPRTAQRAIPRGELSQRFALGTIALAGLGFIAAASGFYWLNGNLWPVVLAPVVLAYLAGYSYSKQVTALCHLMLGGALALSPIAAVIAVAPPYLAAATPWLLAAMVTCWVAGFDVIYALQDLSFDRVHGVYSIPAKIGADGALWVSRGFHTIAAVMLALVTFSSTMLGTGFALAAVAAVGLLVAEHALVAGSNEHRIPLVFITINGLISLLLGAAGIVDIALTLNTP
jgi:4-hydroxybenzoate polyprenyltransferase